MARTIRRSLALAAAIIAVTAAGHTATSPLSPCADDQRRGVEAEHRDDPEAAIDFHRRALECAEGAGDVATAAATFEDLAFGYIGESRSDLALALANRELAAETPLAKENRAIYLLVRGVASSQLNDAAAAEQSLAEALPLAEASGNLRLIALIHRHRGLWIWRTQRNLEAAEREYAVALRDARSAGAWGLLVGTLNNAANPYRNPATLDLPKALAMYEEALEIARRERLDQSATLLKNIGEVHRQLGETAEAEHDLGQAIEIADRRNVTQIRWMARLSLAMLLRDSDPVRAEREFSDCLDLLDAWQNGVLLEDFRPGALAAETLFADPYDEFIAFLLARGRPADAFFVQERARARAFLDTLADARRPLAASVPKGYSEQERRLLDAIREARLALRGDDVTDARRAQLLSEVNRLEQRLSALRLQLAVDRPALAHARYPRLWHAEELQARVLAPDETLLAFFLGARASVAWVITSTAVHAIALPSAAEIETRARKALDELRDPYAKSTPALAELSHALEVAQLEKLAGGNRIVVVPHGILNDVPFEALVDPHGARLVERYAISYAPSASSLAFLQTQRHGPSAPAGLLAVANPVVGDRDSAVRRQFDLAHIHLLEPLPHSGDEARGIATPFGASARVLEGNEATRAELLRSGIDRWRIVHFATHGLIDEEHPERSGLLLTADPPRDDGLLQARDVYSLHLNADLVTLSACETALGRHVSGEGIIGLTRAFFFAGARSVVASLWDVEDSSTRRFMERFYANLRGGMPIDVALQRTKISFLRDGGAAAAPFEWAAFVVSGDARKPIPIADRGAPHELLAAIVLIALIVLAFAYRAVNARRGDTAMR